MITEHKAPDKIKLNHDKPQFNSYSNYYEYLIAVRDRGEPPHLKEYQFKTAPYDHQARSFEWARMLPNVALLLDMGLGKTKVTIDSACYRFETRRIKRVVVICPLSVVSSWVDEIKTHCKVAFQKTIVVTGTKQKRIKTLAEEGPDARWIIINDDGVRTVYDQLEKFIDNYTEVVKDESITIKNHKTKRFKSIYNISRRARYRKILTGAVITNNLLDVWSQYMFLDDGETLGKNFYGFRNRYFYTLNMGQFNIYKPREGAEQEIKGRIYQRSIRYTKAQCLDLPDKVFITRHVKMIPAQERAYNEMKENLIAEVNNEQTTASVIITKLLRLSQITAGFIMPDTSESATPITKPGKDPKNNEILSIIGQTEDQLVIWCRFRYEIESLTRFLNDKGYKTNCIYGDVKQPDRADRIDGWRDGDIRILVCQVGTAGMGITLLPRTQKGVAVIYRSNDYSLNNRLQSQDRTHRIGLKSTVTYVDLVCPGTIDETIIKTLSSKKNLADAVTERDIREIVSGE